MDPTISVLPQILEFIKQKGTTTAKEIQQNFDQSQVTIFKHLKKLLEQKAIIKTGTPPKVYYIYNSSKPNELVYDLPGFWTKELSFLKASEIALFENKFLNITPEGFLKDGYAGFEAWCRKQGLETVKTTKEYLQVWKKYAEFYIKSGNYEYIDASFKLRESFGDKAFLDKLFYLDFYAIERFGKTKLAQLTFQAKQSQDKANIGFIIPLIQNNIKHLIKINGIEAVGFVPATVSRKVQFMELLEQNLGISLPKVRIEKIIYDTPVQQKTLKSKDDRIENATKTFYIPDQQKFSKVMLIDDFVGSGATLNQISVQIKQKQIAKKVYGLGLTGSFKGFEVVNQV
ncbi:MAG: DeoR family transcriptional regulator [bacterium]